MLFVLGVAALLLCCHPQPNETSKEVLGMANFLCFPSILSFSEWSDEGSRRGFMPNALRCQPEVGSGQSPISELAVRRRFRNL